MKIPATAALLSCLVVASARGAVAADNKTNTADYPLAVHVSAAIYTGENSMDQILTVTIAGKHYQLLGPASGAKFYSKPAGLINPGDYHAKLTMDDHKSSYESMQQFEVLFPDGSTRRFNVIAQSE